MRGWRHPSLTSPSYLAPYYMDTSEQAEKIKIANPTFLDPFDLRVHMPGHFPPWDVVFSYHPGPLGPGPNPPRPDPPILTVLGC